MPDSIFDKINESREKRLLKEGKKFKTSSKGQRALEMVLAQETPYTPKPPAMPVPPESRVLDTKPKSKKYQATTKVNIDYNNVPTDLQTLFQNNVTNLPQISAKVRDFGADLSKEVGKVSDTISERFKVAQGGEFKDILQDMRATAESLNVKEEKGFFASIKGFFVDRKREVESHFQTAKEQFDKIIVRVDHHVENQRQWIDALLVMRQENYSFYEKLNALIAELENDLDYLERVKAQLQTCPKDSPDAHTAVQQITELDSLLRRTRTRINDMSVLRGICDQNLVIINQKRDACSDSIDALKSVKTTIPEIKKQFALYMAAQENADATELAVGLREQMNSTLKTSSDFNKKSTIEAREAAGKTSISVDTLKYMQDNILETVTTLQNLDDQHEAEYHETKKQIEKQRNDFFEAILEHNEKHNPLGK